MDLSRKEPHPRPVPARTADHRFHDISISQEFSENPSPLILKTRRQFLVDANIWRSSAQKMHFMVFWMWLWLWRRTSIASRQYPSTLRL